MLNRLPVFSIDGYRETGRLWRHMRVVGFNINAMHGPGAADFFIVLFVDSFK